MCAHNCILGTSLLRIALQESYFCIPDFEQQNRFLTKSSSVYFII
jgi:hypothetical protein